METRATQSGKAFNRQEVYSVGYDCATADPNAFAAEAWGEAVAWKE